MDASDACCSVEERVQVGLGHRFAGMYLGARGVMDSNGPISVMVVDPSTADREFLCAVLSQANWTRGGEIYPATVGYGELVAAVGSLSEFVRAASGTVWRAYPNIIENCVVAITDAATSPALRAFAASNLPGIPVRHVVSERRLFGA